MKRIFCLIVFLLVFLTGCELTSDIRSHSASESDVKITSEISNLKLSIPESDPNIFLLSGEKYNKMIWVNVYQTDKTGKEKDFSDKNTNLGEMIKWVSTNENVATVSNGTVGRFFVYLNVNPVGEGITEIYAQTIDGKIKSDVFTLNYGNKYNWEATVTHDMGIYLLSRLKYPTKTEKVIKQDRDPWYFNYRKRRIYVYKELKESSYVDIKQVDWKDKNVTIKGEINTFSSGGGNAICGFIVELKYNDDLTQYQIITEKYDAPELIRLNIN